MTKPLHSINDTMWVCVRYDVGLNVEYVDFDTLAASLAKSKHKATFTQSVWMVENCPIRRYIQVRLSPTGEVEQ